MLSSKLQLIRRFLVLMILLAVLGGNGLPALAGTETLAQAQKRHIQAKIRSWSRSVVKLDLRVGDMIYSGTGVYVLGPKNELLLITADHVIVNGAMQLGDHLFFRSYNADPDDPHEWHPMGAFANTVNQLEDSDLAIFHLRQSLPGMVPAHIADADSSAGETIVAFGFAARDGHTLVGQVTGANDDDHFLAVQLGADHGDSGGPAFDAKTGEVVGIISSLAPAEMSDHFVRNGPVSEPHIQWSRLGTPMGADAIVVHLPAVLGQ